MGIEEFKYICRKFNLGEIQGDPQRVLGGLLNEIWKIKADGVEYAVKIMNVNRSRSKEEYDVIEVYTEFLHQHKIPAVSALKLSENPGEAVLVLESKNVLVFPWINARPRVFNELTTHHRQSISSILAEMHALKFQKPTCIKPINHTVSEQRWHELFNAGQQSNAAWYPVVEPYFQTIIRLATEAAGISKYLKKENFAHRDLTSGNVLWSDDQRPYLIDWEWASVTNATVDFVHTALLWSGMYENKFDHTSFSEFLIAYQEKGGCLNDDIESAFYASLEIWLDWLAYNLDRSVNFPDKLDKETGELEVFSTLKKVMLYNEKIREWVRIFTSHQEPLTMI